MKKIPRSKLGVKMTKREAWDYLDVGVEFQYIDSDKRTLGRTTIKEGDINKGRSFIHCSVSMCRDAFPDITHIIIHSAPEHLIEEDRTAREILCETQAFFGTMPGTFISVEDFWTKVPPKEPTNPFKKSLTKKVMSIFKKEPQKSLIDAGLMTNDEMPTNEGVKYFVAMLLQDKETAKKFKEQVADKLLED